MLIMLVIVLALAPKENFFRVWKNNIGKVDEIENNEYYINEFYHQILENLDPQDVYKQLDNSILLCYEGNNQFCHRHLVAAWFELFLDVEISEIKVVNDELIIVNKPAYIKEYLEEIIKKSINMKNYATLRELYLNEKNKNKQKKIGNL